LKISALNAKDECAFLPPAIGGGEGGGKYEWTGRGAETRHACTDLCAIFRKLRPGGKGWLFYIVDGHFTKGKVQKRASDGEGKGEVGGGGRLYLERSQKTKIFLVDLETKGGTSS